MKIQFSREIELDDRFDVIVVGGGPAGCSAAISAARMKAKTLLIESSGALGGMGTIGLVPAWCPFSDQKKMIYRGVAQEVFEKTRAEMAHVREKDLDWVSIDAEVLKRVYDEMVTEAGARVLFNTQVSAVANERGRLQYILTSNKCGLTAYRAKVFVDCTGDADLIAYAGAPFDYGDEKNGEVQPATHCFTISNVDDYWYEYNPETHGNKVNSTVESMIRSDSYPLITDGHSCNSLVGPGTVGFNAGHLWNVDSTDPFSVSEALMQGRRIAHQYHQGLMKFDPKTYAGSFLVSTAPAIGIRESRRVIGDYTLTVEDYMERRSFPDEVGRNCYFLDVHHTTEERDRILKGELDENAGREPYAAGESHGIPYRCLIPQGLDNVLVAGKNISCDHILQGSVRVMPVCLVTGQAAGTAAAMAAAAESGVRGVDIPQLRNQLQKDGAYFQ